MKLRMFPQKWGMPQFGLRSFMFVFVIVGILSCWWADRNALLMRLSAFEGATSLSTAWSTDQALGPPNTSAYGDIETAWASATPDGQKEWLELTYKSAITPSQILINETYNPGAVYRVTGFDSAGQERLLWSGKDPKRPGSGAGLSKIKPMYTLSTNRIRIYIDSPAVPGWNEIDAVGMKDNMGRVYWAQKAKASSSYGQAMGGQNQTIINRRIVKF